MQINLDLLLRLTFSWDTPEFSFVAVNKCVIKVIRARVVFETFLVSL